jgi:hypothetical protein
MEVNAVMPAVPKYMHWLEQEITWSRQDTPRIMPTPGAYALMLNPTFVGPQKSVSFGRNLIDDGSNINIMYKETFKALGFIENMLQPTHCTFHGIVS